MQLTKTSGTIFWFIIGILFFIPFNGNVHLFDWDEINFAEISREMLVRNNFLEPHINFISFTEKPPLYFWLQALSMKLFGINEFAARFPNALLGAIVLPVLFRIGTTIRNARLGMFWALAYFGSVLPALYFKSGIIDPIFNFFIFLSICYIIKAAAQKQEKGYFLRLVLAGIFTGIAILTKGPVALLIVGLTLVTFFIIKKFTWFISFFGLVVYGLSALFVTSIWLIINYFQTGNKFIIEFTIRQWQLLTTADAGHGGFFLYHFVVLFFGCFPAIVFTIFSFFNKEKEPGRAKEYKMWMSVLFWVVLILFTLVNTKIVHYSSLCYYPLSFLAALSIDNILSKKWRYKTWMTVVICISSLPFILAPFILNYLVKNMDKLKPLLAEDPFAVENLAAKINWSGYEFVPGLIMLLTVVIFILLLYKNKTERGVQLLFWSTAIWVQLGLYFYIKNIEGYSQRANIEFWQTKDKEDCYLTTYNYKSYTQYFYGNVKPQQNSNANDMEWLLKGAIDKPVYISCKTNNYLQFQNEVKDAKLLYNQNGFYFYKRSPVYLR